MKKSEKIVKLASEKRHISFSRAMKRLGYTSEKPFMLLLNRMVRKGFVNCTISHATRGKSIQLNLTQTAYYCRSAVVPQ